MRNICFIESQQLYFQIIFLISLNAEMYHSIRARMNRYISLSWFRDKGSLAEAFRELSYYLPL